VARFEVPKGWTAQRTGSRSAPPAQERALRSHAGRRPEGVQHDARAGEGHHGPASGRAFLRHRRGRADPGLELVPGGAAQGVEQTQGRRGPVVGGELQGGIHTGLDALSRGSTRWSKSKKGERAGAAIGFPKFKSARSRRSVRFTTGTLRAELTGITSRCLASGGSGLMSQPEARPPHRRRALRGSCPRPCPRTRPTGHVAFQVIVRRSAGVLGHAGQACRRWASIRGEG